MEWLAVAAGVIVIAIMILAYFDLGDAAFDLLSSLAQLAVAAVTLTIALLAFLLNALKRLVKKQSSGNLP